MTAETPSDPLPASVSEYAIEYPGATPTRIMHELDLDSTYRAQVEHFCAVTRYSDQKKWTVRKEETDDSGRGQHASTNLSDHSAKKAARKAAVEWMRNH